MKLRDSASASPMASQFRQLILDEFKPIVLVTSSPAAAAALERNNLSFDQLFAPHAEAPLPPVPPGSVKEGSPFWKLDGTLAVRFVDASSYSESDAEAEESLVKALTKHNSVSGYNYGCTVYQRPLIVFCRLRTVSACHSATATRRKTRRSSCSRAECRGLQTREKLSCVRAGASPVAACATPRP
jgi:hypothetical protein